MINAVPHAGHRTWVGLVRPLVLSVLPQDVHLIITVVSCLLWLCCRSDADGKGRVGCGWRHGGRAAAAEQSLQGEGVGGGVVWTPALPRGLEQRTQGLSRGSLGRAFVGLEPRESSRAGSDGRRPVRQHVLAARTRHGNRS